MPSVNTSQFKCCTFSKDLSIIFENVDGINLDELRIFLEKCKEEEPKFLQFGNCVQFLFEQKEILLRGFKLTSAWIASESSSQVHKIPLWESVEDIVTTLYYFYHMSTVV